MTLSFERAKYGQPLFTRYIALWILSKYGKARKDVLTLFHSFLNDKNFLIRSTAVQTLGDIGDESDLPDLEKLAKDKNDRAADAATESIDKIKGRHIGTQ
jgi:HEAT repeat protein